jgi:hypothetical protein
MRKEMKFQFLAENKFRKIGTVKEKAFVLLFIKLK